MKTTKKIEGFHKRVMIVLNKTIERKGMTPKEIAHAMGIKRSHLYVDNQWGSFKVARFCAVTGCSADWLLGLRGGDPFD